MTALIGYRIRRMAGTVPAWIKIARCAVLAGLFAAIGMCAVDTTPAWVNMWLLCGAVFLLIKLATLRAAIEDGARPSAGEQIAYLFGWVGMDAAALFGPRDAVHRGGAGEWIAAISKTMLGAALLWVVAPRIVDTHPHIGGWIGMSGLIFLLHFGGFHFLSLIWRVSGRRAAPIMAAPIRARSVGEFWGRRWNRGFRDQAQRIVFEPIARRFGPTAGAMAVFIFSGVVHDLVISLPARGGFGGPTLYFALQGAALLVERSRIGRGLGFRRGVRGWLFTAAAVMGPVYLLFHPPFVERVILPFMSAIGAA